MTITEFTLRIAIASIAGIVIGFERQWRHKSAGLRTNTLVCIGAALYVLISIKMTTESGDVTRIIGQVVTGVGFLGAGIIYKQGINIQGLTTAAIIWCSSAIGCLAGAGFYIETIIATLILVLINILLVPIDKWLDNRNK